MPILQGDYEAGVIQSQHEINWKPKKAKVFGAAALNKDAIVLSEFSFLKGSCVEAYCCDKCKKIIIDYGSDAEDKEN